jgi:hypothetical protein
VPAEPGGDRAPNAHGRRGRRLVTGVTLSLVLGAAVNVAQFPGIESGEAVRHLPSRERGHGTPALQRYPDTQLRVLAETTSRTSRGLFGLYLRLHEVAAGQQLSAPDDVPLRDDLLIGLAGVDVVRTGDGPRVDPDVLADLRRSGGTEGEDRRVGRYLIAITADDAPTDVLAVRDGDVTLFLPASRAGELRLDK